MEQDVQISGSDFDSERYRRWTSAFIAIQFAPGSSALIENAHWHWAYETVRSLARLDAKLTMEDHWAADSFLRTREHEAEPDRYRDHEAWSRLWILGAYELLRTLVEKLKKKETSDKHVHEKCIRSVKNLNKRQGRKKIVLPAFERDPFLVRAEELLKDFERLRMPMAKLQPAQKFKSDNPFARPGLSREGVGWTTAEGFFVTRTALAERLILVLAGYTPQEMTERSCRMARVRQALQRD